MSQSFINVHIFDGKLNGIFKQSKKYSIEEKNGGLTFLIDKLTNIDAITTVQTIISDMTSKQSGNFQPENNLDASDILIELIQWIDNPDILNGLNEQLTDIRNLGICPSGRVTRLLQLWTAFVKK